MFVVCQGERVDYISLFILLKGKIDGEKILNYDSGTKIADKSLDVDPNAIQIQNDSLHNNSSNDERLDAISQTWKSFLRISTKHGTKIKYQS